MRLRPKDVQRMLKSMGVKLRELDASEVLITLRDGSKIKIVDPQVIVTQVGAQEVYQVTGKVELVEAGEQEAGVQEPYTPSEEDIELVASQAGVDKEKARKALIETKGDLAEAIMKLMEEGA